MSARELQRTAVRMLHDPAFLARVYADPDAALAGLDLSAAERGMIVAADRRAWHIDPHRRWRVLTALLAEHAVTVASLGTPPHALEAFFGDAGFHDAIGARRSLVLAFGAWLEARAGSRVARALLALERAFVGVRRAPLRPSVDHAATMLVAAPHAAALALPTGTLASWEAAARVLRREGDAVAALIAGRRVPAAKLGVGLEHVLVERPADAAEPTAAFVGEGLYQLLAAAAAPIARATLTASAQAAGLEPAEAREVIADLVADGLLVPA